MPTHSVNGAMRRTFVSPPDEQRPWEAPAQQYVCKRFVAGEVLPHRAKFIYRCGRNGKLVSGHTTFRKSLRRSSPSHNSAKLPQRTYNDRARLGHVEPHRVLAWGRSQPNPDESKQTSQCSRHPAKPQAPTNSHVARHLVSKVPKKRFADLSMPRATKGGG